MTARRLHLVGASGSGTTTLGRAMHGAWLAALPCPVFRLEDVDDVDTRLKRVLSQLA